MEACVQQYLVDMETLALEAENILLSAEDKPIYEDTKTALLMKFDPVLERMDVLREYLNHCPASPLWAECAQAYAHLNFHMEALMKHNKRVIQI